MTKDLGKIELHIKGMHCGSCVVGIQMLASQMDGVQSAEVSYEGKKGTFEFDSSKVSKDDLIKTIAELGYQASWGKVGRHKSLPVYSYEMCNMWQRC